MGTHAAPVPGASELPQAGTSGWGHRLQETLGDEEVGGWRRAETVPFWLGALALESDRPGFDSGSLLTSSVSLSFHFSGPPFPCLCHGDGKTQPAGLFRALNETTCAKLSAPALAHRKLLVTVALSQRGLGSEIEWAMPHSCPCPGVRRASPAGFLQGPSSAPSEQYVAFSLERMGA